MASRESEDDDLPETVSFQEAKKVSLDVSRQQNENLKRYILDNKLPVSLLARSNFASLD
jgi:hypothetical protein